jgi:hypothetical protein
VEVDATAVPVTVRYATPGFICLGSPRGLLTIWPDSMSASEWRRLVVSCRWHRAQGSKSAARSAN